MGSWRLAEAQGRCRRGRSRRALPQQSGTIVVFTREGAALTMSSPTGAACSASPASTTSRYMYAYGDPKTASARRTVDLFDATADVLRTIQPLRVTPEMPVFVNTNGRPIEPN